MFTSNKCIIYLPETKENKWKATQASQIRSKCCSRYLEKPTANHKYKQKKIIKSYQNRQIDKNLTKNQYKPQKNLDIYKVIM